MFFRVSRCLLILYSAFLICSGIVLADPEVRELRPDRAGTHFRAVDFAPGTRTAWASGFEGVILKTTDGGLSWIAQHTGMCSRFYDIQAVTKQLVFTCGTNGTLLRTEDGGTVWEKLPVPTHKRLVGVFFFNALEGWVVGDSGLLLQTLDAGKHWDKKNSGVTTGLRHIHFISSQTGYAVGYHGITLRTRDGGKTWIRLNTPKEFSCYGADFHSDGSIYLAGSFGMVVRSEDFGDTWEIMKPCTTNFLRDIRMDTRGFGTAVGYGLILRFDPASNKWHKSLMTNGYHLQSVAFGADGCGIAVGRWGIIYTTSDNGKTWRKQSRFFSPNLLGIASDDRGNIVAVGVEGHILFSHDLGKSWRTAWLGNLGDIGNINAVCSPGTGIFYAATQNGRLLISRDAGRSWKLRQLCGQSLKTILFITPQAGFITGNNGKLFVTEDGGATWKDQSPGFKRSINGICFIDREHGWLFGGNGLVMDTQNHGGNWIGQYTGVNCDFTHGGFDSDGHAIVVGPGCVLESYSLGYNSSWERIPIPQTVTAVSPDAAWLALADGALVPARFPLSYPRPDPCTAAIHSFCKTGNTILGAGNFGRIVILKCGTDAR